MDITSGLLHQDLIRIGYFTISDTMIVTWCIMLLLVTVSKYVTSNLQMVPNWAQSLFELYVDFIKEIAEGTIGKKYANQFLHIGGTMFIYIFICNTIDIIPFPGLRTPTSDLTLTFSLAFMVFVISHIYGVKTKGFFSHLKELGEPIIFMLPLNIIGELAKPVSHSFRLFGNIAGGSIIVAIIGSFANDILVPVGLNAYFGLFAGTIQAFIFTMLTFAYISNALGE